MPMKKHPGRIAVFSELPSDVHRRLKVFTASRGLTQAQAILQIIREAVSDILLPQVEVPTEAAPPSSEEI